MAPVLHGSRTSKWWSVVSRKRCPNRLLQQPTVSNSRSLVGVVTLGGVLGVLRGSRFKKAVPHLRQPETGKWRSGLHRSSRTDGLMRRSTVSGRRSVGTVGGVVTLLDGVRGWNQDPTAELYGAEIRRVGAYYARHGYLWTLDTTEWHANQAFSDLPAWFFRRAQEVFPMHWQNPKHLRQAKNNERYR